MELWNLKSAFPSTETLLFDFYGDIKSTQRSSITWSFFVLFLLAEQNSWSAKCVHFAEPMKRILIKIWEIDGVQCSQRVEIKRLKVSQSTEQVRSLRARVRAFSVCELVCLLWICNMPQQLTRDNPYGTPTWQRIKRECGPHFRGLCLNNLFFTRYFFRVISFPILLLLYFDICFRSSRFIWFSWVSLLLLENKFRERKIIDALLLWLTSFNMHYVCAGFAFMLGIYNKNTPPLRKMFGGCCQLAVACNINFMPRSLVRSFDSPN